MNKVLLIGWGVMLAAFVYATRELQASHIEIVHQLRAQATSSNFPVVIPKNRQNGPDLHKKGAWEPLTSPKPLGCNCQNQPSHFQGLQIKRDMLQSIIFRQNIRKALLASYGQGECPKNF